MSALSPKLVRSPKRTSIQSGQRNRSKPPELDFTEQQNSVAGEQHYAELKRQVRDDTEKQQNHKYMQLSKEFLSFHL